ncbi:MAG: DUF2891 domain-containing protein [Planctomycetes bacterium]|nr:DUF2891 domain-containing protein [Planctomycetota bacterium]
MKHCRIVLLLFSIVFLPACSQHQKQRLPEPSEDFMTLDQDTASRFAQLALEGIQREYPNKLGHVMNHADEVKNPAALHPAFYGSFDWHSSVHGHWMLVRLLRRFPQLPEAPAIRRALHKNLSEENMAAEVAYLNQPNRASFERTYGWAWLLKLEEELHTWNDGDGRVWSENLAPLAQTIAERYLDFLPKQTYPIRRGVHPNTAFGIAFALDYAQAVGHQPLEHLLVQRSLDYFGQDENYPAQWEPDGDDFFSRSLMEADLMRRLLPTEDFAQWLHTFLPDLEKHEPQSLLEPPHVSDRSDPKIAHLDGLPLSRPRCMKAIAGALPANDPTRPILAASARRHAQATLPHIASGHYEGEHWLASFAVYLLTEIPGASTLHEN